MFSRLNFFLKLPSSLFWLHSALCLNYSIWFYEILLIPSMCLFVLTLILLFKDLWKFYHKLQTIHSCPPNIWSHLFINVHVMRLSQFQFIIFLLVRSNRRERENQLTFYKAKEWKSFVNSFFFLKNEKRSYRYLRLGPDITTFD